MSVSHALKTYASSEDAEVGLADIAELYALFAQVADPRRPRGVRHHIATVLTVMVLTVLAGARNFREAGDRAADLPPLLLRAAGARRAPRVGGLRAPSGSTLRRVVEGIDADAADQLVCHWIAQRVQPRPAVTVPSPPISGAAWRWTARRYGDRVRATRKAT